ncbi:MAG: sulfotransferase [Planctomycetota bacterium]
MGEGPGDAQPRRAKVVGIGLNKTGTKTLGAYLSRWGYRNRSYDSDTTSESPSFRLFTGGRTDELLDEMERYDSFEDWPWPLLYREIDARYPDARFVLTERSSADVWFRSLCNMAVRLGPMPLFERHVYGSALPQGHRARHVGIYEAHGAAVREHFADRPEKLLCISWDRGEGPEELAEFLGLDGVDTAPLHVNPSPRNVYDGNSVVLARLARARYRWLDGPHALGRRVGAAVRRRLGGAKTG